MVLNSITEKLNSFFMISEPSPVSDLGGQLTSVLVQSSPEAGGHHRRDVYREEGVDEALTPSAVAVSLIIPVSRLVTQYLPI